MTEEKNKVGIAILRNAKGQVMKGTGAINPGGRPKLLGSRHARRRIEEYAPAAVEFLKEIMTGDRKDERMSPAQAAMFIVSRAVPVPKAKESEGDPDESDTLDLNYRIDPDTGTVVFGSEHREALIGPAPWEEKGLDRSEDVARVLRESTGD